MKNELYQCQDYTYIFKGNIYLFIFKHNIYMFTYDTLWTMSPIPKFGEYILKFVYIQYTHINQYISRDYLN